MLNLLDNLFPMNNSDSLNSRQSTNFVNKLCKPAKIIPLALLGSAFDGSQLEKTH